MTTGASIGPVPAAKVQEVTDFLRAAGILKPPLTLEGALKQFQQQSGLPQTGILDVATAQQITESKKFIAGLGGSTAAPQSAGTTAGGLPPNASAAQVLAAISGPESNGNYTAQNSRTKAYGRYQILPSNWSSWAVEAGLAANAPQTPQNQDIVAQHKMAQYVAKYGVQGAIVAWYGGEGAAQKWVANPNDPSFDQRPAPGEPTIREYVNKVSANAAPSSTSGSTPAGGTSSGTQAPAAVSLPGSNDLVSLYGWASAFADVPELKAILDQATSQQWTQDKITAAVMQSDWYRQRNANQVNWEIEKRLHPQDAMQKANDLARSLQDKAAQIGFTLDNDRANNMAVEMLTNGLSADQEQKALLAEYHYQPGGVAKGQTAALLDSMKKTAASYMVPVSDQSLAHWVDSIIHGTDTEDSFNEYIQTTAKGMYPALGGSISAGMPTSTLLDPYKQIAQQELGTPVDMTDPKIYGALFSTDPKSGQRTMMNADQFRTYIRTDPRFGWNNTVNATNQAATFANQLAKEMGAVAT